MTRDLVILTIVLGVALPAVCVALAWSVATGQRIGLAISRFRRERRRLARVAARAEEAKAHPQRPLDAAELHRMLHDAMRAIDARRA